MKISIFPKFEQKSTILTWMSRQEGFVATESQAKVPNVCGLREIPAKDKYADPTLEVLTKDLATASKIVRMLGRVSMEHSFSNSTKIEADTDRLRFVVVAKAHDFWQVSRALKTISFVNTEKEMVKGDFEGELIAGEVYLKDGEATFSGEMMRRMGFKIQNPPYPNHREVAEWMVANPLFGLSAITPEVSKEGMPQPAIPQFNRELSRPFPAFSELAFSKKKKDCFSNYWKGLDWQAFLDWAKRNGGSILLKGKDYLIQFEDGDNRIDFFGGGHTYPIEVDFRFTSVPNGGVFEKIQALLGLSRLSLVSRVEHLILTIETLYNLGFHKAGAEEFYEFVQWNGFVAKYDISEKEMTTSQTFFLPETTPEQLAVAKKKVEAFITKVMDAAENRPKEVKDGEKIN